jgi:hypothetical protein
MSKRKLVLTLKRPSKCQFRELYENRELVISANPVYEKYHFCRYYAGEHKDHLCDDDTEFPIDCPFKVKKQKVYYDDSYDDGDLMDISRPDLP